MAIYHLSAQTIKRSGGRSAVASASYRAREKMKDERQDLVFDYRAKEDLVYKKILAPANVPSWATDREKLWNEVEKIEKRKDSQVAREINIALPVELDKEKQIELIETYAENNFVNQGMIADICIHDKDGKNPHAHIMLTMRDISREGFGNKKREWNNKELLQEWRKNWSRSANVYLELAGSKERIDHRSYEERGLEILPQKHESYKVRVLEAKGVKTRIGDYNREIKNYNSELEEINKEIKLLEAEKEIKRAENNKKIIKKSIYKEYADVFVKGEQKDLSLVERKNKSEKTITKLIKSSDLNIDTNLKQEMILEFEDYHNRKIDEAFKKLENKNYYSLEDVEKDLKELKIKSSELKEIKGKTTFDIAKDNLTEVRKELEQSYNIKYNNILNIDNKIKGKTETLNTVKALLENANVQGRIELSKIDEKLEIKQAEYKKLDKKFLKTNKTKARMEILEKSVNSLEKQKLTLEADRKELEATKSNLTGEIKELEKVLDTAKQEKSEKVKQIYAMDKQIKKIVTQNNKNIKSLILKDYVDILSSEQNGLSLVEKRNEVRETITKIIKTKDFDVSNDLKTEIIFGMKAYFDNELEKIAEEQRAKQEELEKQKQLEEQKAKAEEQKIEKSRVIENEATKKVESLKDDTIILENDKGERVYIQEKDRKVNSAKKPNVFEQKKRFKYKNIKQALQSLGKKGFKIIENENNNSLDYALKIAGVTRMKLKNSVTDKVLYLEENLFTGETKREVRVSEYKDLDNAPLKDIRPYRLLKSAIIDLVSKKYMLEDEEKIIKLKKDINIESIKEYAKDNNYSISQLNRGFELVKGNEKIRIKDNKIEIDIKHDLEFNKQLTKQIKKEINKARGHSR